MSTISASPHGHLSTSAKPSPSGTAGQARSVEADPGPWLVITGPLMIALSVIVVSWLSLTSF